MCQDFSEHGIAPRGITTSQEFSSGHKDLVQDKARAVSAQAALIPGDTLLEELITPARCPPVSCRLTESQTGSFRPPEGRVSTVALFHVRSSIGVELLRKMGWKEGQGVGPRVKRRARQHRSGERPSGPKTSGSGPRTPRFHKPERCCNCPDSVPQEAGGFMAACCPLQDRRSRR